MDGPLGDSHDLADLRVGLVRAKVPGQFLSLGAGDVLEVWHLGYFVSPHGDPRIGLPLPPVL